MFESAGLPALSEIAGLPDPGVVDAMTGALRTERAASARKVFAAAELFLRREAAAEDDDRDHWRIDGFDLVAAEVGAAQGITRHKAAAQLRLGVCLREDVPLVGEKFAEGLVDYWVVDIIAARIGLLDDADKARIDKILARCVGRWNRLSRKKMIELVDSWVVHVDYLAKRPTRTRDDDRHIEFGSAHEGLSEVWGSVRAPAAAAVHARLDALAATVCGNDPRTKVQRRADALEAMAAGLDRMACCCDSDNCAAGETPASPVRIHVLADAETVHGQAGIPGYLPGYGALPAELVRAYVRVAKLQRVPLPDALEACEGGYRPSAALLTYVKLRDLTCRFPGCEAPAEVCDVDHTVPWPYGPTHPSNVKLLCRHHHLIKTFFTGPGGWQDSQRPDGTVVWTSPTGHTYVTKPGGALFFPQFAQPTAKLVLPENIPPSAHGRSAMMPTRERTRAEERRARIDYERALNYQRLIRDADPPPF